MGVGGSSANEQYTLPSSERGPRSKVDNRVCARSTPQGAEVCLPVVCLHAACWAPGFTYRTFLLLGIQCVSGTAEHFWSLLKGASAWPCRPDR